MAFSDWFKRAPRSLPKGVPAPDQDRELALYKSDLCGYCVRVLRALDRLGLQVELRDVLADSSHRQVLREATGRSTVPCLLIDGVFLFESADIISWLEAYADRAAGAEH